MKRIFTLLLCLCALATVPADGQTVPVSICASNFMGTTPYLNSIVIYPKYPDAANWSFFPIKEQIQFNKATTPSLTNGFVSTSLSVGEVYQIDFNGYGTTSFFVFLPESLTNLTGTNSLSHYQTSSFYVTNGIATEISFVYPNEATTNMLVSLLSPYFSGGNGSGTNGGSASLAAGSAIVLTTNAGVTAVGVLADGTTVKTNSSGALTVPAPAYGSISNAPPIYLLTNNDSSVILTTGASFTNSAGQPVIPLFLAAPINAIAITNHSTGAKYLAQLQITNLNVEDIFQSDADYLGIHHIYSDGSGNLTVNSFSGSVANTTNQAGVSMNQVMPTNTMTVYAASNAAPGSALSLALTNLSLPFPQITRYIFSTFNVGIMTNGVFLLVGSDATNLTKTTTSTSPPRPVFQDPNANPPQLQTPKIVRWNNIYVMAYDNITNGIQNNSTSQRSTCGIAYSYDLNNWVFAGYINFPTNYVNQWSPQPFIDATNGLHLAVAMAQDASGANFHPFVCSLDATLVHETNLIQLATEPAYSDFGDIGFTISYINGYYWFVQSEALLASPTLTSNGWNVIVTPDGSVPGAITNASFCPLDAPYIVPYKGRFYIFGDPYGQSQNSADLTNWVQSVAAPPNIGWEEGIIFLDTFTPPMPVAYQATNGSSVFNGTFTGYIGNATNANGTSMNQMLATNGNVPLNALTNVFNGSTAVNGGGFTNVNAANIAGGTNKSNVGFNSVVVPNNGFTMTNGAASVTLACYANGVFSQGGGAILNQYGGGPWPANNLMLWNGSGFIDSGVNYQNPVFTGKVTATNGYILPQLASIPTNSMPVNSASVTNWTSLNLNGTVYYVATNFNSGGWLYSKQTGTITTSP